MPNIIQRRLIEQRREQIAQNIRQAKAEYLRGELKLSKAIIALWRFSVCLISLLFTDMGYIFYIFKPFKPSR